MKTQKGLRSLRGAAITCLAECSVERVQRQYLDTLTEEVGGLLPCDTTFSAASASSALKNEATDSHRFDTAQVAV